MKKYTTSILILIILCFLCSACAPSKNIQSNQNDSSASQSSSQSTQSQSTPSQSTPSQSTPSQSTPSQSTPSQSTPSQSTPSQSTPSQSTPSQSTPSQSTPSQSTPSQSTPSQSTPSQSTPSQSTPSQSTPSQSTPSQSTITSNIQMNLVDELPVEVWYKNFTDNVIVSKTKILDISIECVGKSYSPSHNCNQYWYKFTLTCQKTYDYSPNDDSLAAVVIKAGNMMFSLDESGIKTGEIFQTSYTNGAFYDIFDSYDIDLQSSGFQKRK